jgi:hypothetical protein
MAQYTTNVTETGNTYLCDVFKPRHANNWEGTVHAQGTWGGTTLTLGLSIDDGVTVVPIDSSEFSLTDNGAASIPNLGTSAKNSAGLKLYAIATDGTGINLTVTVLDNR